MQYRKSVQDISWVEMQYTDIVGRLRSTSVPYKNGRELLAKVDGSSIGIESVDSSDAVLVADSSTLSLIPWHAGWGRVICDIYRDKGLRHPADPRYVTQRLEGYLREVGMVALVGVEVEFFVFEGVRAYFSPPASAGFRLKLVDKAGRGPLSNYQAVCDRLGKYRLELVDALSSSFGVEISGHHHEAASSQLELNVKAGGPTSAADGVQTVKYVAKALADLRGLKAVFMPKPIYGENGSGMHIHLSLWRGSKNVFYDPDDRHGLSQLARYFIGGLLYHARALAAIVAPTVNSYRRLVPGFESPVYAVWGHRNRSAAVRIPLAYGEHDTRVEFRPPDPSASPYLAIAAVTMAGIDGIKRSIDPGEPLNKSAYELACAPKEKRLPSSLAEALCELASDRDFLKPVFADELLDKYIDAKNREVVEVSTAPSPVEFLKYQDI